MSETSGNKQRLLIVDDSKVIRVTARKILQSQFETVEAVDGNNAWEILNGQPPFSLIISDLTMPNLDGFGLLEKIRGSTQPHIRNIPVIIITGANDSEATMQRATAAGATDFIGKPFDSVHLLARTQAHATAYEANNSLTEENLTLEDRSLSDPLTGLANDTALMEKGCSQLAYAMRHGTTLALASIEIDDYGELVRTHGEGAGERVIKSVCSVLKAKTRTEDVAARIGTARFALLLPGMETSGVIRLTERIKADISKLAVFLNDRQVRFTASIGITVPEIRPDITFDDLLAAAADSLKEAMDRGGNRVLPEVPPAESRPADEFTQGLEAWTLEPVEQSAPPASRDDDELLPETGIAEAETAARLQPSIEDLVLEAESSAELEEVILEEQPAPAHEEFAADMQTAPAFEEIALEEQSAPAHDGIVLEEETAPALDGIAPEDMPVPILDDIVLDDERPVAPAAAAAAADDTAAESAPEEMDETIVITSPYSLFDLDEVELDSTAAHSETTADAAAGTGADAQPAPARTATAARAAAAPAPAVAGTDADHPEARPGVMRRLFGALFGRRE